MKGQVKANSQKEDTPTSMNPESEYQKQGNPSSSTGISQELIGKNDDIYRLFVVPFDSHLSDIKALHT